jgi:hypothetical protein
LEENIVRKTIKEILFPNSTKEENILRDIILANSLKESEKIDKKNNDKEKVIRLFFA